MRKDYSKFNWRVVIDGVTDVKLHDIALMDPAADDVLFFMQVVDGSPSYPGLSGRNSLVVIDGTTHEIDTA